MAQDSYIPFVTGVYFDVLLVSCILFLAQDLPETYSSCPQNPFLFLPSRPRRMLSFGETHKYLSGNYFKECIMSAMKRSSRLLDACSLTLFQDDGILTWKNYKLGTGGIDQAQPRACVWPPQTVNIWSQPLFMGENPGILHLSWPVLLCTPASMEKTLSLGLFIMAEVIPTERSFQGNIVIAC